MKDIKYYLIHNLENERLNNMNTLFEKYLVPKKNIELITYPNKNQLTYKIKKKAVMKKARIKDGWISCSYKHYLALEDMVKNNYELAVIMEDNIGDFYENIPDRLAKYLALLPENWGIVFDSVWGDYKIHNEEKVVDEKLLYKKNNNPTFDKNNKLISHGSTRAAQFYFINLPTAKIMYKNFLPFNHSADMWMNHVIRKNNINVYWSEPSLVKSKFNKKTSTNLELKDLPYKVKSEIFNLLLGI